MRDNLREQLNKEMTRKQFLQYLTGALLMVFGLHNLVSLLTGSKHIIVQQEAQGRHGFGSRSFGN